MNEPTGTSGRTSFAANLITPRTVLIFVAGFLLALFLARTLPDVGLFHPEGRIIEKDIVITGLNPVSIPPEIVDGIVTSDGEGIYAPERVWDSEVLRLAKEQGFGRSISVDAHIIYVESSHGTITLRIEPRD